MMEAQEDIRKNWCRYLTAALVVAAILTAGTIVSLWHLRNQDWTNEVNLLRESIFDTHLLFDSYTLYNWQVPKEVSANADDVRQHINAEADALIARIPWMSDREIALNLPRLVAPLKDGHSAFGSAPWLQKATPFFFRYFADGYYFSAYYDDAFPQREAEMALLGSRLVAVNGHPPEEVEAGLLQLRGCENVYDMRFQATTAFMSPAMLTIIGLNPGLDIAPTYTVETLSGQQVTLTPSGLVTSIVDPDGFWQPKYSEKVMLAKNDPANRANDTRSGYELAYLDGGTVLHFRCFTFSGPTLYEIAPDVADALTDNPQLERIIVDVRGNPGGHRDVAEAVLYAIRDLRPELWQRGDVYVATDGGSYSASIYMANWLKTLCGATIVGEPTGQGLWFFYGTVEIELPKSGLSVYLSPYHSLLRADDLPIDPENTYDGADAIYPDVLIERTIEQYMEDVDPVLEWILAQ